MESRQQDIDRFYTLLNSLKLKFPKRALNNSNGKQEWPDQGIYFFFEKSEKRENGKSRIVRIGTHAVSKGSKTKYWDRLKQHKGTNNGLGNHRGSVFRKLIGISLINRDRLTDYPYWARKKNKDHTQKEKELESIVSNYIGKMEFLSLSVAGESSKDNMRAFIETNSIALISNKDKIKIDPASENWLGKFSNHKDVISSGIWNSDDTEKDYNPEFLDILEKLILKQ